jgi:hypothetical protein
MAIHIRARERGDVLGSGIRNAGTVALERPAAVMDAAAILRRLEEAGATLLAMPSRGYSTHMRAMRFDIVHTALEAYGWEAPALRPPAPSAAAISNMDVAFGWLRLIPEGSYVLRRIVGARALVHPLTGRHLYSWRRLATLLGADHKSVQRWHEAGLSMIEKALSAA